MGVSAPFEVRGWDGVEGAHASCRAGRGVVVLASHAGCWEQGARQLASFGLRPLVIVAPWPQLPRSEDAVAAMRARGGVLSACRGRRGWREATLHLRAGGAVVVLIDSASARPRGRRALPFVGGNIAAPDAVIAWARRNGAALWVATAEDGGYALHVLGAAGPTEPRAVSAVHSLADRSVALLRAAISRRPSNWAWIRPLVLITLGVTLASAACQPLQDLPPLPLDPATWVAEAEGLRWSGSLRGDVDAAMQAQRLVGRWRDDGVNGRFESVQITLLQRGDHSELGEIHAARASGRWPEGPITLSDVRWRLSETLLPQIGLDLRAGHEPQLGWTDRGKLSCGGCALEGVRWGQAEGSEAHEF